MTFQAIPCCHPMSLQFKDESKFIKFYYECPWGTPFGRQAVSNTNTDGAICRTLLSRALLWMSWMRNQSVVRWWSNHCQSSKFGRKWRSELKSWTESNCSSTGSITPVFQTQFPVKVATPPSSPDPANLPACPGTSQPRSRSSEARKLRNWMASFTYLLLDVLKKSSSGIAIIIIN